MHKMQKSQLDIAKFCLVFGYKSIAPQRNADKTKVKQSTVPYGTGRKS